MKSTRGNTMERKLGSRKWFSGWNLSNTYTHQGMEELEIKRISLMQVWCAIAIIQSLSHIWFFETPDIAACQASLSFTIPGLSSNSCPSHPLLPPSPPALNLSQHQNLFQWVGSSHQVTKSIGALASASALPMNIQGWFSLGLTGLISLLPHNCTHFTC